MDVHAEKLQLIEWLVSLKDTNTMQRLLEVKKDSEAAAYESLLKPMKVEELLARAQKSNLAITSDDHIAIEDALTELED